MTVTQLWIFGALCAVIAIIWIGDLFFSAPKEDFDTDMSQKEQEAMEMIPGVKVDREILSTMYLPPAKRRKTQAEIRANRAAREGEA